MIRYTSASDLEKAVETIKSNGFVIPEGWDSEVSVEKAENLCSAIQEKLGESSVHYEFQDTSDYARISLPKQFLLEPDNPYVFVALSKLPWFATVLHEWDVKPEALKQIEGLLDQLGFDYVCYSIFGNPVSNHWSYDYSWQYKNIKPPEGKGKLLHEDLWHQLFDYA